MKLSDEDRDGLTAAEIAAIEAEDDDTDAGAGGADDDGQQDDGDAASTVVTPGDGEDKGGGGAVAAATPEADDDEAAEERPQPVIVTPAVEDFDTKVGALRQEKDASLKKLMDGEITAEEYAVVENRVTDEIADMRIQQRTHETDAKRAEQTAFQQWQWECERFMKQAKRDESIDYSADAKLGKELDAQVRLLAGDPDNADREGDWFLTEAHKRVKAIHGITKATLPAVPPPPPPLPSRRPDLSGVPPSIARAPVAAESHTGDDEFSHLRNLSGEAYERAIAGMTADQLDRFMEA